MQSQDFLKKNEYWIIIVVLFILLAVYLVLNFVQPSAQRANEINKKNNKSELYNLKAMEIMKWIIFACFMLLASFYAYRFFTVY